jgi:hypothetical protein
MHVGKVARAYHAHADTLSIPPPKFSVHFDTRLVLGLESNLSVLSGVLSQVRGGQMETALFHK